MPSFQTTSQHYLILRNRDAGFFALFAAAIGLLDYYETHPLAGVAIDFKNEGHYFDETRGLNWWAYYFEPLYLGSPTGAVIMDVPFGMNVVFGMKAVQLHPTNFITFERSNQLIQKYIKIKPEVSSFVDNVVSTKFAGQYVIGIHYRGTDKVQQEAPVVPYTVVVEKLEELLKQAPSGAKIFIATDEEHFLSFMVSKYGQKVMYQSAMRSQNGKPVHLQSNKLKIKGFAWKKGFDALVDCLLLSRCNIILKTASNLSTCSRMFNPNLQVVSLSYEGKCSSE